VLYNLPVSLRLAGELDVAALERALGEVVRRHDSLRTRFAEGEGAPVLVAEVRRRAAEEAFRPFDLAAGPLFRARLLRLAEREHVLLLAMHHIVSDGWSLGVLLRELSALYAACREGRPPPLPEPPLQYAAYARWQREQLRGV